MQVHSLRIASVFMLALTLVLCSTHAAICMAMSVDCSAPTWLLGRGALTAEHLGKLGRIPHMQPSHAE